MLWRHSRWHDVCVILYYGLLWTTIHKTSFNHQAGATTLSRMALGRTINILLYVDIALLGVVLTDVILLSFIRLGVVILLVVVIPVVILRGVIFVRWHSVWCCFSLVAFCVVIIPVVIRPGVIFVKCHFC